MGLSTVLDSEYITYLGQQSSDWWYGMNLQGKTGLFPSHSLKPLTLTELEKFKLSMTLRRNQQPKRRRRRKPRGWLSPPIQRNTQKHFRIEHSEQPLRSAQIEDNVALIQNHPYRVHTVSLRHFCLKDASKPGDSIRDTLGQHCLSLQHLVLDSDSPNFALDEQREQAAIKIQARWRGAVVRSLLRRYELQYCAAVTLQRLWRGVLVRIQTKHKKIMQHHRLRRRNRAQSVQHLNTTAITSEVRCLDFEARTSAATVIQSCWRRMKARKVVIKRRESQVFLASAKTDYVEYCAAIQIQRTWRGTRIRREQRRQRQYEYARIALLEHSHETQHIYHVALARERFIKFRDRRVRGYGVLMALAITGTHQGSEGWYYEGGKREKVYYFKVTIEVRRIHQLAERTGLTRNLGTMGKDCWSHQKATHVQLP